MCFLFKCSLLLKREFFTKLQMRSIQFQFVIKHSVGFWQESCILKMTLSRTTYKQVSVTACGSAEIDLFSIMIKPLNIVPVLWTLWKHWKQRILSIFESGVCLAFTHSLIILVNEWVWECLATYWLMFS